MKRFTLLIMLFTTSYLAADPIEATQPKQSQLVDLKEVFAAAPVIYSTLSLLSIASMAIFIYSLATVRARDILPQPFVKDLKTLLKTGQYEEATAFCQINKNLLSSVVLAGLSSRKLGPQLMIDAMKSEGKRAATAFWQRLSLLNDIVVIAPMLGLLGTVIGMFYAFYDVNRSIESINALFDGLGIAVGTTVAGLVVAIIAMIFYTTLKFRIVKTLSQVENEALAFATLIDNVESPSWK
jgi:biopolymer transport protein ExbB